MRRSVTIMAALAVAALVLAPALAEAQRGGGGMGGSRGARTFQAPPPTNTAPRPAQPMQRTQQQPTAPTAATPPAAAPNAARPAAPAAGAAAGAAARPGFLARNPFLGGMMLGLFGAGLFGLLAGSGFFSGLGSLAGILGFLLQIALIVGVVMLVMAFLRRRQQPQPAGMARDMQEGGNTPPMSLGNMGRGSLGAGLGMGARPAQEAPVQVGPADYQAFEQLLAQVNEAWTHEDMTALSRIATPEVVGLFRDDLAEMAARGLKNETTATKLEQGDLAEAWREGAREYATVAMRYSMLEVTREAATGRIVEGSETERAMGTEVWTFMRIQGGPWMLSAIQRAG